MFIELLEKFGFLLNRYVFIGILCVSLFSYGYYLKYQVDTLTTENAQLQDNLTQTIEREKAYVANIKKISESVTTLEKQKTYLAKKNDELQKVLNRENFGKKSLEELAEAKPALVEKRINDASKRVLSCIEVVANGGICE